MIGRRAEELVRKWCRPEDVRWVTDLLQDVWTDLARAGPVNEAHAERLQLAVLKVGKFLYPRMVQAVDLARVDWRDLLVAADFELREDAHLTWHRIAMERGVSRG